MVGQRVGLGWWACQRSWAQDLAVVVGDDECVGGSADGDLAPVM